MKHLKPTCGQWVGLPSNGKYYPGGVKWSQELRGRGATQATEHTECQSVSDVTPLQHLPSEAPPKKKK